MSPSAVTQTNSFLDSIVVALLKDYPKTWQIRYMRVEHKAVTQFEILTKHDKGQYKSLVEIDDMSVMVNDSGQMTDLIMGTLKGALEQHLVGMGESITGKYPFTRLWADNHLVGLPPLLMHPDVDVPGWVHNKYRGVHPKEGSVSAPSDGMEFVPDVRFPVPHVEVPPVPRISVPRIDDIPVLTSMSMSAIREAIKNQEKEMAGKKVVVKKRVIDPNKIKKPNCRVHGTPMGFDAVSQKWRCDVPGCDIVARPKRDEDDRSVVLGKGGLQVRVITQDGEVTVLLVSDDNVALNITKFVDVEALLEEHDAYKLAEQTAADGRENFATIVPHAIVISMPLHIWGASELIQTKS